MTTTYIAPDFLQAITDSNLATAWLAAEEAVARIDERVGRAVNRDGLAERLHVYNGRAAMHAQHFLIHLDDLVLFDADAYDGPVSLELSHAADLVRRWRRAAKGDAYDLLHATMPATRKIASVKLRPIQELIR